MDGLVDDFVLRKPTALERIYALWSPLFVSVARHAVRDIALAEDCVHDALVRVWRSPNRFSGNREMLKASLVASVRNESLLRLRSDARRDVREQKAARLAPVSSIDPPAVDPVETARLQRAMERLPEDQRIALTLAYYGNKTHVEVAAALGAPLGTVKSRIAMAMRKLHAELADAEGKRA
jgi:RNA polymerase sigma factor (sigma-70 family)